MQYLIMKYLATAGVVVLVSELAKRSDRIGSLVAVLPLVTVLTLLWLYLEHQPVSKLSDHACYTFWYVIPALPIFLLFLWLIQKTGLWPSLGICVVFTTALFLNKRFHAYSGNRKSNLKAGYSICRKSLDRSLVRLDDRFRDCKSETSTIAGFLA